MQKGRGTTELLTVNDAFMNVMSYTDFFCVALGDALRAISMGERVCLCMDKPANLLWRCVFRVRTLCEGKVVSASVQVLT